MWEIIAILIGTSILAGLKPSREQAQQAQPEACQRR
jgi:hypothetical protein